MFLSDGKRVDEVSRSNASLRSDMFRHTTWNKHPKYCGLLQQHYLILPFAVENLGVGCLEAISFIKKLGKMIPQATAERKTQKCR